MNIRDEQYFCNRVSNIDRAVGGLQVKVEEQQELIEKLTKRIDKLEDNNDRMGLEIKEKRG